jgi:putative aldouronate transport system substrate-binding protein
MVRTKLLTVVLVLLVLPSMMIFAGGEKEDTDTTETASMPDSLEFPLEEPVTVHIMSYQEPNVPVMPDQDTPWVQKVKELTGVQIDFELVLEDGYEEAVNTMLAAGVDLPEVVFSKGANKNFKLANDGIFMPITDYVYKYADNLVEAFEDHPDWKQAMTFPDGEFYMIGSKTFADTYGRGWIINLEALDAVDEDIPVTTDDWYNTMVKWKNAGYDFPISTTWGLDTLWSYAWGLHHKSGSYGFWPDENGNIQYEFMVDRAKEYYTWMNKIYEEGLLDPEFDTQSADEMGQKIANGEVGAITMYQGRAGWIHGLIGKSDPEEYPERSWVCTAPPKGPYGDQFFLYGSAEYVPASGYALTHECENPAVAVKLLDWAWSSLDSQLVARFGIEGTTYEMVDGKPKWKDGWDQDRALKEGYTAGQWPLPFWHNPAMWEQLGMYDANPRGVARNKNLAELRKYVKTDFPVSVFTPEEQEVVDKYFPDVETYTNEMRIKFIKGQTPLSEWDSYVKTLENMGINELIKVWQARYDRVK